MHAVYNRLSPFKIQISDEFYAHARPGYGIFFALENVHPCCKGAAKNEHWKDIEYISKDATIRSFM